jgi:hypothetical protein
VEVTPILNVSDLQASFEWFAKLGWEKGWDWCPPDADSPTFGAVTAEGHEIFLCLNGLGGRGEHGVWLSLWVDDVDAVHTLAPARVWTSSPLQRTSHGTYERCMSATPTDTS